MTGRPGRSWRSQARNSSAGKVNGSARRRRARGSKPIRSGQPAKCQVSSARRVAFTCTGARGPTRPAHRLMAGVSSISCPVPTTDSAAQPTRANGWSTAATVATMSSSAPAWGRVAVTTTRSGRSPSASSTAPATSPVACEATGCSDRALAKGTAPQSPAAAEADVQRPEVGVQTGVLDRRPGRRAVPIRCGGCATGPGGVTKAPAGSQSTRIGSTMAPSAPSWVPTRE